VAEGITSLKTVKEQLCSQNDVDYKQLMKATEGFFKQAMILSKQQRGVMPRSGRMPSPMPMKE
jgi:hypothetical protein